MNIELKTFQQRLLENDPLITEEVFSAMISEGADPTWSSNSNLYVEWVKAMPHENRIKLLKIMNKKIMNKESDSRTHFNSKITKEIK